MLKTKKPFLNIVLPLLIVLSCITAQAATQQEKISDPFEQNRLLARGANLGNALEARKEGQMGVVLEERYFELIKNAGFNSVRIPVRWSAHALPEPPYTIEPAFFDRVDWAVKNALDRDLRVVLNMHHYREFEENPEEHSKRFLELWQQIAEHYKNCPDSLLLEFLNEPCRKLDAEKWNQLAKQTLNLVRQSNPKRTVVIGPGNWNNLSHLDRLQLPEDDRNIIVTCHYYSPFNFTHQGASWVDADSDQWLGTTWTGTEKQKQDLIKDFDTIDAWAKKNNRPIYIGEFGAYSKADMPSRALWTDFVARQAEERNFSWAYWEFCAGFGIYDRKKNDWNHPLLNALIPPK
jgi:endoglucanase